MNKMKSVTTDTKEDLERLRNKLKLWLILHHETVDSCGGQCENGWRCPGMVGPTHCPDYKLISPRDVSTLEARETDLDEMLDDFWCVEFIRYV
jgi:hypothetical protein